MSTLLSWKLLCLPRDTFTYPESVSMFDGHINSDPFTHLSSLSSLISFFPFLLFLFVCSCSVAINGKRKKKVQSASVLLSGRIGIVMNADYGVQFQLQKQEPEVVIEFNTQDLRTKNRRPYNAN